MFQIQYKLVKNPDWGEADQLAIYERRQGIETRDFRVINPVGGQGGAASSPLGPAASRLKELSGHLEYKNRGRPGLKYFLPRIILLDVSPRTQT